VDFPTIIQERQGGRPTREEQVIGMGDNYQTSFLLGEWNLKLFRQFTSKNRPDQKKPCYEIVVVNP
jgi:hypothetical protein